MSHAFGASLPPGLAWRDLFDFVIVGARKPQFFQTPAPPLYEVATVGGEMLLRPAAALRRGGLFQGGSAQHVEAALGVSGDDILCENAPPRGRSAIYLFTCMLACPSPSPPSLSPSQSLEKKKN